MFVKFEQTNLKARPEGAIWINPDNVCTVKEATLAESPVTLLLTSAETYVYVLGDVTTTLYKLTEGS